tara:strand:- start:1757 stop:2539 length:783 start_codon:yes stop_codon:yes gene_type:complete
MNIIQKFINLFKRKKTFYKKYDINILLRQTPNSFIYLLNDKKKNEQVIGKYGKKNYITYKELFNLQEFQHPRIINLIDNFTVQNKTMLIFEYYFYGDLFDHVIKKFPLTEAASNIIFKEMVKCVKACHSLQLVHLDVKLENFLIKSLNPFELVITDLAYSEICIESLNNCDTACGTPQYIAPELYNYKYGYCSDVWSLGVCLYMLITGKHIHDKNNKIKLELEDCSVEVKNLILKMLMPNTNLRITIEEIEQDVWYNNRV